MTEVVKFSYRNIDVADAKFARDHAKLIRKHGRQTIESLMAMGECLTAVKDRLGHGNFMGWIDAEFNMSDRTAQKLMRLYERFKSEPGSDLGAFDLSALYALSAAKTPAAAVDAALARAESGQRVSKADALEIIAQHRAELEFEIDTDDLFGDAPEEGAEPTFQEVIEGVAEEVLEEDETRAAAAADEPITAAEMSDLFEMEEVAEPAAPHPAAIVPTPAPAADVAEVAAEAGAGDDNDDEIYSLFVDHWSDRVKSGRDDALPENVLDVVVALERLTVMPYVDAEELKGLTAEQRERFDALVRTARWKLRDIVAGSDDPTETPPVTERR